MTDPTGGAGKVAAEMLKEVQSAMQQADSIAKTQQPTSVEFQNVMGAQKVGAVQEATAAQNQQSVTEVLRAATRAQRTAEVPSVGQSLDTRPVKSGFKLLMENVAEGQNKLEEIMRISLSGRNFSSAELLALQAGVYRFTQELELTSKVIEKGTSSIKQTLNTQV